MLCVVSLAVCLSTCTPPLPCTDDVHQLLGQHEPYAAPLQVYLPSNLYVTVFPYPAGLCFSKGLE